MKAKSKKPPLKCEAEDAAAAASSRFESDLLTRGEAAEVPPGGKLPKGATHGIVKKPDGTRQLKRGRFSLL